MRCYFHHENVLVIAYVCIGWVMIPHISDVNRFCIRNQINDMYIYISLDYKDQLTMENSEGMSMKALRVSTQMISIKSDSVMFSVCENERSIRNRFVLFALRILDKSKHADYRLISHSSNEFFLSPYPSTYHISKENILIYHQ